MPGNKHTILAATALVAGLALAACTGDTGPAGQDGLGYVPVPAVDQALGEYDPLGDPVDQMIGNQLADSTGVWELQLDGAVQLDLGDGAPPVFGDAVRWDSDHNELWISVDGEWVALTPDISIGCLPGVPQACIEIGIGGGDGDYADLAFTWIGHGPATDTYAVAHYGVKTAAADMPTTGAATYAGAFEGVVSYTSDTTDGLDFVSGSADLAVEFGTGTGSLTFDSSGAGADGPYSLTGTATIDGNSYSGTVEGDYDDGSSSQFPTATFVATESSLSGSFYGPVETGLSGDGPLETAGVVDANTDPLDPYPATLIGGFVSTLE